MAFGVVGEVQGPDLKFINISRFIFIYISRRYIKKAEGEVVSRRPKAK